MPDVTATGLSEREEELIRQVLQRHEEVTEARVFGSRAKGSAQPNSDIDLALWGNLSSRSVTRIAGELEELSLPYRYDVVDVESVRHEPLREHIERVGKLFYRR